MDGWIDRSAPGPFAAQVRVRLADGLHTLQFFSFFFFFEEFSLALLNPPHGSHPPIEPEGRIALYRVKIILKPKEFV